MSEDEPNLVTSPNSQHVLFDGYRFSIEIYRLEGETTWTLEVIDQDSTSHVWDEPFNSDKDACNAAMQELKSQGALTFMRGNNIIPFSPLERSDDSH